MRSDQTTFCPACRVRFSPRTRCPACDGAELYRLDDEGQRRHAVDAVARIAREGSGEIDWNPGGKVSFGWIVFVVFSLFAVAFVLLGASGALQGAELVGVSAGGAVVVAIAMSLDRQGRRRSSRPRVPRDVRILPHAHNQPEVSSAAERATVRGVVRVRGHLTSPLAGEQCAAFRLLADGVNDGAATTFDIVCDDGSLARFDGGHATIDIAVDDPPEPREDSEALRAFLAPRLVRADSRAFAEGLLRDGDRVEIEGSFAPEPRAEGYRDDEWVRVFRDEPDSPLIIRARARP